jgi:hypothetical protein
MAVAEASPAQGHFAARAHEVWHGQAFGIALESAKPLRGLPVCSSAIPAVRRIATWHEERARVIDDAWPLEDAEVVVDLRHTDGRVFMRIDRHATEGYRIWAPYYGRHIVAADGRAIRSALPNVSPWRWQRLFFAQALPLAAALQGLEVLHASAVAIRGRIIAFVGSSGSGKTSVAAHAIALGASFVTDELLAVESDGTAVLAHPGPARLSIDDCEMRHIPDGQRARVGPTIGRSDKLIVEPTPISVSLPLDAVYFLTRPRPEAPRLSITDADADGIRTVMKRRFQPYVDAAEQLTGQLDAWTAIAEMVRVYDVLIPEGARAREVAATALAHADQRCTGTDRTAIPAVRS